MTIADLSDGSFLERKLNILLIATRGLGGQMTGRKAVLRTTTESLVKLGHRVLVAHFDPDGDINIQKYSNQTCRVRHLRVRGPRPWELVTNIALGFLTGRKSLNECLYDSRSATDTLQRVVRSEKIDVVVTDMIRTAAYGERLGLPWIADLDDLLSLRYKRMAKEGRKADGLLGYHRAPLLRTACRMVRPVLRGVLWREAKIISNREIAIARKADLVSTVSQAEAALLSSSSLRPILTTPICMPAPSEVAPVDKRMRELVFLGSFSYQPNRDAVTKFDNEISEQLKACGLQDVDLFVVGEEGAGYSFSPNVRFVGYVEDLDRELQKYRAMLIPELLQGGIKTKVVHAALNDVLVLAHESAIAGMGMEAELNVLTWRTPHDLASLLTRVRRQDPCLSAIIKNARYWAQSNFGEDRARARWMTYLASVMDASARSAAKAENERTSRLAGYFGVSSHAQP